MCGEEGLRLKKEKKVERKYFGKSWSTDFFVLTQVDRIFYWGRENIRRASSRVDAAACRCVGLWLWRLAKAASRGGLAAG
jgi:hypothetical protein